MSPVRIAFRVPAGEREEILDRVLPLLAAGVTEREVGGGAVEIASVGAAGALPDRERLEAAAGRSLEDWRAEEVPADWRARRGRFGGGFAVGDRLLVRAPWDPPAPPGAIDVVVERGGSAFGSGSHPTTQMCLTLLVDLPPSGGATDLGCGAGTLAIAAARLGWAPVTAIDREASAVELAAANARRNGVDVECVAADLAVDAFPPRALLLANAPPTVQERVAAAVTDAVRHVIVSGMVEGELAAVRSAYARAGLQPVRGLAADTWVAVLLGRDGG